MTCELTLTGNLVVGGGDCGCSGSGGASPTKIQPLGLSCGSASYGSVGSTDCGIAISSPSAFIPLPVSGPSSISLLCIRSNAAMTLRWGGSFGTLTGAQVLGGVTFAGGEVFEFDTADTTGITVSVSVTFSAGTFTLQQVVATINAAAVGAGASYLPAAMNAAGTAIVLTAGFKGASYGVIVTTPLAAIGFSTLNELGEGTNTTSVSFNGTYLVQHSDPISDVEIMGSGTVTILAAGAA